MDGSLSPVVISESRDGALSPFVISESRDGALSPFVSCLPLWLDSSDSSDRLDFNILFPETCKNIGFYTIK